LPHHFDFEEQDLFPLLVEAGDGDLAALLAEEHVTILAIVADVLPLARAAAQGTQDDGGYAALKRATLELADRLADHIDKETKALLPRWTTSSTRRPTARSSSPMLRDDPPDTRGS